eukprot:594235-Rhodomonas_salina.2
MSERRRQARSVPNEKEESGAKAEAGAHRLQRTLTTPSSSAWFLRSWCLSIAPTAPAPTANGATRSSRVTLISTLIALMRTCARPKRQLPQVRRAKRRADLGEVALHGLDEGREERALLAVEGGEVAADLLQLLQRRLLVLDAPARRHPQQHRHAPELHQPLPTVIALAQHAHQHLHRLLPGLCVGVPFAGLDERGFDAALDEALAHRLVVAEDRQRVHRRHRPLLRQHPHQPPHRRVIHLHVGCINRLGQVAQRIGGCGGRLLIAQSDDAGQRVGAAGALEGEGVVAVGDEVGDGRADRELDGLGGVGVEEQLHHHGQPVGLRDDLPEALVAAHAPERDRGLGTQRRVLARAQHAQQLLHRVLPQQLVAAPPV